MRNLNNALIIGANGSRWEKFYGALDDIRIFNHTLSESEIISLNTGTFDDFKLNISSDNQDIIKNNDTLAVNVNIKNESNENKMFHQWATLTLVNNNILSHRLAEEITIKANSDNTFNKNINMQSWYPT